MNEVERLSVIEDIRQLMAQYTYHADMQEWDSLVGLFTADGVFTSHAVDGTVLRRSVGRDEIAHTLVSNLGEGAVVIHHLFASTVEVNWPEAASGIWSMEDLLNRPPGTNPDGSPRFTSMHGYGHYRPRFAREQDGWRIAELSLTRVRLDLEY